MSENLSPVSPSRSINPNKSIRKRLRCHALMVGEISYAWNDLHITFWRLFITVFGQDREEAARYLWNSSKSDSAQRKMLLGLCKGHFGNHSHIYKEIFWASRIAEFLSQYRNSLAHTFMIGSLDSKNPKLFPFTREDNPQGQRINEIYDKRLFYKMRGDLVGLKNFVAFIDISISHQNVPLPNKPLLKAFPEQYKKVSGECTKRSISD